MNALTRDIMKWLKIDVELALDVQYKMMETGISFGSNSTRELKQCAKECLDLIK